MKIFSIYLLTIFYFASYAQTPISGQWSGMLTSSSGLSYPINFNIKEKNSQITGTVKTYGPNNFAAICGISGIYAKGILSLNEQNILQISDKSLLKQMCLIKYILNKKEENGNYATIKGIYKGRYKDGSRCDSGSFYITQKFNKAQVEHLQKDLDLPLIANQDNILTLNEFLNFNFQNQACDVYVWDHGAVDGDSIKITDDDSGWSQVIALEKEPKQIHFNLKKNEIKNLSIAALNEGTNSPNTCKILISEENGNAKRSIETKLNKKDKAYIHLNRK